VLTENSSFHSINDAITNGGWNTVFSGNRTCLKIVGVDRLPVVSGGIDDIAQLTGVTNLDLSLSEGQTRHVYHRCVKALLRMCPNVADVDLSHVEVFGATEIWNACSNSEQVTWKGCRGLLVSGGIQDTGIEVVNLSDSVFRSDNVQSNAMNLYGTNGNDDSYMFHFCPELRRLDIKNASWHCQGHCHDMPEPEDLPQEIIIKMVRHHPNLVWLRSDLTDENVAMLQEERPEITFVSE
jgi:hypothetical protein